MKYARLIFYAPLLSGSLTSCAIHIDSGNVTVVQQTVDVEQVAEPPEPAPALNVSPPPPPPPQPGPVVAPPAPPRPKTIIIRQGCGPMTMPTLPAAPRVSNEELSRINRDDLKALNEILLNNIAQMNAHNKAVQKIVSDAVAAHLKSCHNLKK